MLAVPSSWGRTALSRVVRHALRAPSQAVLGSLDHNDGEPIVQRNLSRKKNGESADFKVTDSLRCARSLKSSPKTLAAGICAEVEESEWANVLDARVGQTGAVDVWIRDAALLDYVGSKAALLEAGEPSARDAGRVLIDYASPNLCKELHAGHLRSSVLGDTLRRMWTDAGFAVRGVSHVGDWGVPMVMAVTELLERHENRAAPPAPDSPAALSELYVTARRRFDAIPEFAQSVRANTGTLHRLALATQTEPHAAASAAEKTPVAALTPAPEPWPPAASRACVGADEARLWAAWVALCRASTGAVDDTLRGLDVRVPAAGESHYAAAATALIADLRNSPDARVQTRAGATILPTGADANGAEVPLGSPDARHIVLERSGGHGLLYAATDLAALRWRAASGADTLAYVVDDRQALHFADLFAAGRRLGWIDGPGLPAAEHVSFGIVRAKGGGKLSSREGTTLTLQSILDDANAEATRVLGDSAFWRDVVGREGDAATREERAQVARAVGVACVRFFELAHDRAKDYEADAERMLAFKGASPVSVMYAVARIQSVLAKAARDDLPGLQEAATRALGAGSRLTPHERALCLGLATYQDALDTALRQRKPHVIAEHVLTVAGAFHAFYAHDRVLGADEEELRLALCSAAGAVMHHGLGVLGVTPVQRL